MFYIILSVFCQEIRKITRFKITTKQQFLLEISYNYDDRNNLSVQYYVDNCKKTHYRKTNTSIRFPQILKIV